MNFQEVYGFFKHYSECKEAILLEKKMRQNVNAALWIIFLFFPALFGSMFPENEPMVLLGYLIALFFSFKGINIISQKIVELYLNRINKSLGKQIKMFRKYDKIVNYSVLKVLDDGSENFKEDFLWVLKNTK